MIASRVDNLNIDAVSDIPKLIRRKKSAELHFQVTWRDFVGIQIEDPVVPALIFSEALLLTKARPVIVNDACPGLPSKLNRTIATAAVHNYDFVDPIDNRLDTTPYALCFILCNNEA